MLSSAGDISFADEIMGMVDEFVHQYEEREGPLTTDLDKGLVISFALGAIRNETEYLWDALGSSPDFDEVALKRVYEDMFGSEASQTERLVPMLQKRCWAS